MKKVTSKEIKARGFGLKDFFLLSLLFLYACKPPAPGNEQIRVPTLLNDSQYGKENELLTINLVASLPDPEFKTDRLNPARYKAGDLSFACSGACPEGLLIDHLTGLVSWTPSYEQAGVHFITFTASSGIFSSQKTIPIIILDVDRAADVPKEKILLKVKEGELLDYQLSITDPDGDSVQYFCVSGCPADLSLDSSNGKILWTPDFNQAGMREVEFKLLSRPSSRQINIRGLAPGEDSEAIRLEVEKETIDRNTELKAPLYISIEIENVDRVPEIFPVPNQIVMETETLSLKLKATDPDGDEIHFLCSVSCPSGLVVDGRSGDVLWQPSFEQEGKYLVEIKVLTNEKIQGSIIFKIDVLNKNRAPFFNSFVSDKTSKEGQLLSFSLPGSDLDKQDTLFYQCISSCPAGMLVSGTGLVAWIPSYEQSASYSPVFSVSDGNMSATASVNINIEHVNRKPYFLGVATNLTVPAALAMRYNLIGKDDDKEDVGKVRYACFSGCPEGLSIDNVAGQINWFPTYEQIGSYTVSFSISDGSLSSIATIIMEVTRTDRAPRFTSTISVQGEELKPLSFLLQALDADGDSISYSCTLYCPQGLLADASSGQVTWTPSSIQSGTYTVVFRASSYPVWDNTAIKNTDIIANIYIKNFNRPPVVDSLSDVSVFEGGHLNSDSKSDIGHGLSFQIHASDVDGDSLSYLCFRNCPAGLVVNPASGLVTWTPLYSQAKPLNAPYTGIEFAVTDGEFLLRTVAISITVIDVNRPPEFVRIDDKEVFENGHFSSSELSALGFPLSFKIQSIDSDETDTLVYSCLENCPDGLTVAPTTGEVRWTPRYDQAKNVPNNSPYENIVFKINDGKSFVLTNPISITVKNVNRAPKLSALAASYQVFENGHLDKSETSPTTAPLNISIVAVDPDGDQLSYSCVLGCPKGLTINQTSGEIYWKPSYCTALENKCFPQDANNEGAKKDNAPYSPIIFQVSDGYSETQTSPISISVLNVDRSPVVDVITDIQINEGDFQTFKLNASDPDGDLMSFKCLEVLITSSNITESCRKSGSSYFFPPLTGAQNFGHTQFFNMNGLTGDISLGTSVAPVGYFDAQKFNAPYQIKYEISSVSVNFSDSAKKIIKTQNVVIRNKDRGAPIAAISPFTLANGTALKEPDTLMFSLSMGSSIDPDAEWEEFRDTVEYFCDPSGIDGCPAGLKIVQNCILTCDYALNPNGCPSASTADASLQCPNKGRVYFETGYGTAKAKNAELSIRLLSRSTVHPEDFSIIEYPPIENKTDVRIQVLNTDRAPVMDVLNASLNVREPCGHKVVGQVPNEEDICEFGDITSPKEDYASERPFGKKDVKTYKISATDPDKKFESGNNLTEGDINFAILGCSDITSKVKPSGGFCPSEKPLNTAAGCLAVCPAWVTISSGSVTVKPATYQDALINNAARYVMVQARACPLAQQGWDCAASTSQSILRLSVVVSNEDRAPDPVVITALPPYVKDPNREVNLRETENYAWQLQTSDPDGDAVFFCLEKKSSQLSPMNSSFTENTTLITTKDGELSKSSVNFSNYGRASVNRSTSGNVREEFKIRACSSSVDFVPNLPPTCEDISQHPGLRCSEASTTEGLNKWDGWKSINFRFFDEDTAPSFSSIVGDTKKEVDTSLPTVNFTYTDLDSYDEIKICAMSSSANMPEIAPDATDADKFRIARQGEQCVNGVDAKALMAYKPNYKSATRAGPRAFPLSYKICYSNGPSSAPAVAFPPGMPVPPLSGTCYELNSLTNINIENSDRLPEFENNPVLNLLGHQTVKLWGDDSLWWQNNDLLVPVRNGYDFYDYSVSYIHAAVPKYQVYADANGQASYYAKDYLGATEKDWVEEYDGEMKVSMSVKDADDEDKSLLEVRLCGSQSTRLETIGGKSFYTGAMTNSSNFEWEYRWDLDYDLLRPNENGISTMRFKPCFQVCYKDEPGSCSGQSKYVTGLDDLGILIKDSDRLPKVTAGSTSINVRGDKHECANGAYVINLALNSAYIPTTYLDLDGDPIEDLKCVRTSFSEDRDIFKSLVSCESNWLCRVVTRGKASDGTIPINMKGN